VFANLLADCSWYFKQLSFSALIIRISQQAIPVAWINMEERWTSQMTDFEPFKHLLPACHPFFTGAIEDKDIWFVLN